MDEEEVEEKEVVEEEEVLEEDGDGGEALAPEVPVQKVQIMQYTDSTEPMEGPDLHLSVVKNILLLKKVLLLEL